MTGLRNFCIWRRVGSFTNFVTFARVAEILRGKSVAIVGSGPTSLDNAPGFVDSHEIVMRVSNYVTGERQGYRCDVHYSFYGTSIRKTREQLQSDGVRLCMCKLPDAKPLSSPWHEARGKTVGVDYRYIYREEHARKLGVKSREDWWFCETYVPEVESFLRKMAILDGHQPTTGFAAILDTLACNPKSVYLTGFDFFASGLHNLDKPWKPGDPSDPIGHRPDREREWVRQHRDRLQLDPALQGMLA